jgi:hypothetical protein
MSAVRRAAAAGSTHRTRVRIEAGIRELGFGELHFLDADGNPVN